MVSFTKMKNTCFYTIFGVQLGPPKLYVQFNMKYEFNKVILIFCLKHDGQNSEYTLLFTLSMNQFFVTHNNMSYSFHNIDVSLAWWFQWYFAQKQYFNLKIHLYVFLEVENLPS